jgi:hypothetical protein
MPKPPSSVRSIRLQDDVWRWLAEEAAERATNVNALVGDLIEVARLKAAERKAAPAKPAARLTKPATAKASGSVVVPLAGTFERKPYQKGQKR